MKETFTAAVLREHFTPLSLETLKAETPQKGQVLVKMITSGLCGAQINEIDAVKGVDKYMPHLMGHEGFGEVLEVGADVRKVKVGDYVVLHWRKGSGHECFGGKYHGEKDVVGSGSVTTFAEQTIVAENRVTKVEYDPELKDLYPLMGCALSTAYGIAKYNVRRTKEDDLTPSVVITGAGGLGLTIAFWLKVLYNITPIMLDKHSSKRKYVEDIGAVFFTLDETPFEFLAKVNYVIDTTGSTDVMSSGFDLIKKPGALILVGQPRVGQKLVLNNALSLFDGISIYSSDGGNFDPDLDLDDIVKHVKNNLELAKKLVTHTIKLDQINDGFSMMRNGEAGRVIINFEESAQ